MKRSWQNLAFLCLFLPLVLLAQEDDLANFDLTLQFDPRLINGIELELICNSGQPRRQQIRLAEAGLE